MYIAATNVPDRQVYGAMYDFGDSLLFLGTLGLAAVPATGAALFFLRGRPAFWKILSISALAIAWGMALKAIVAMDGGDYGRALEFAENGIAMARTPSDVLVNRLFKLWALAGLGRPESFAAMPISTT